MKGEIISVDDFNLVLKHKIELQQAKVYEVGFETVKNSDGKTVIGSVITNSGAEKAGIEVGQIVEGYSIYGSAGVLCELYVLTEKGSKKIEFYPYVLKEVPQHLKE
jgi:hypothetical protein